MTPKTITVLQSVNCTMDLLDEQAQRGVHILSPPLLDVLPWGCVVASTYLPVSVDPSLSQVYPVEDGKVALSSLTLDKLSAALGLIWDGVVSRRLDDQSHPHFCAYRAVGHYRAFDGSWCQIMGDKVTDLRDGSAQIRLLRAKEGKNWAVALDRQRAWIDDSAQTKARQRAMRALGLQLSYRREELAEPLPLFLACRLSFLGRPFAKDAEPTEANQLAMQAAVAIMTSSPGASGQRFRMAPPRPPPVGSVPVEEDDYGATSSQSPAPAQPASQATPGAASQPTAEPAPPPSPSAPSRDHQGPAQVMGPVALFGQGVKGQALSEMSDERLTWYQERMHQHAVVDAAHVAAVQAEVVRRGLLASHEVHDE